MFNSLQKIFFINLILLHIANKVAGETRGFWQVGEMPKWRNFTKTI
jgi:hypothetical protein